MGENIKKEYMHTNQFILIELSLKSISEMLKSNFLKSFRGNANLIACLLTLSCGFVFGFPIGAKLSSDFYKQKLLSKKQATILSIATNNFSPMYVCGFAIRFTVSTSSNSEIRAAISSKPVSF